MSRVYMLGASSSLWRLDIFFLLRNVEALFDIDRLPLVFFTNPVFTNMGWHI